jgi:hypothetical protein
MSGFAFYFGTERKHSVKHVVVGASQPDSPMLRSGDHAVARWARRTGLTFQGRSASRASAVLAVSRKIQRNSVSEARENVEPAHRTSARLRCGTGGSIRTTYADT